MYGPKNVGIKGIALYFPGQCVDQHALEVFDGVSPGKYTIGLGQTQMAFCNDREDIYSMALTAVSTLMRDYSVSPRSIGRLEVGTETILDKSKSVKSVLMQLFSDSDGDIEGIDTINACYGGTAALLNALNWIESMAWNGRDAIVVAGDIALYDKGNARPTGGAGCVAMLIGSNAPLVVETNLRASYMRHEYDFYKPDLTSEYPTVDGPLSLRCYTEALDRCYKGYMSKLTSTLTGVDTGSSTGHDADTFDYMCFHSPTCKTVQKSYARLFYHDYTSQPEHEEFTTVPGTFRELSYADSVVDKNLEKAFMAVTKDRFEHRVKPATQVATLCGNMYTASLYSGLCSLLSFVPSSELQDKRVGMFSYGSGLASSLFSIRVVGSTEEIHQKLDLHKRLSLRSIVPPAEYDAACELREHAHLQAPYKPAGSIKNIPAGAYYLTRIDDKFRREYAIHDPKVQAARNDLRTAEVEASPEAVEMQTIKLKLDSSVAQATKSSRGVAQTQLVQPNHEARATQCMKGAESWTSESQESILEQRSVEGMAGSAMMMPEIIVLNESAKPPSTKATLFDRRLFLLEEVPTNSSGVISVVSLNLPRTKNALSTALLRDLRTYLRNLHGRSPAHTRALVIASSTPGIFCAGADLKERARMTQAETNEYLALLRETLTLIETLPLPTIACLSGPALGGGLELALACHLRLTSEDSVLGLPETRNLGIIPGAGGTFRLAALIGTSRARELILTGRRVGAQQAEKIGLVDRIAVGGSSPLERSKACLEQAVDLALEIVLGAPLAIRAALRALRDPSEAREICEYESVLGTRDRDEALRAFTTKTKAVFIGA